jgi:hypothetical protein
MKKNNAKFNGHLASRVTVIKDNNQFHDGGVTQQNERPSAAKHTPVIYRFLQRNRRTGHPRSVPELNPNRLRRNAMSSKNRNEYY